MIKRLLFFAFVFSLLLPSGCYRPVKRYNTQKLINEITSSLAEQKINVTLKLVNKTLYVYMPVERLFVETDNPKSNFVNFAVDYVNGHYENKVFYYNFYIKSLTEKKKNTQKLRFDEKTRKLAQKVQHTVMNKYMNADTDIEFMVECYADITQGYLFNYITYYKDLRKYYCGALPYEEYSKRIVQDYIESTILVNNKDASGLEFEGITKEVFLSKQIAQRINVYFTREIPPATPVEDIVTNIIKHTLKYYQFEDYLLVQLEDMYKEKMNVLSKSEVENFRF